MKRQCTRREDIYIYVYRSTGLKTNNRYRCVEKHLLIRCWPSHTSAVAHALRNKAIKIKTERLAEDVTAHSTGGGRRTRGSKQKAKQNYLKESETSPKKKAHTQKPTSLPLQ
jgi:hypothetical protein